MSAKVIVDADVISGYFGRRSLAHGVERIQHLDDLFALDAVKVIGHVYQEVLNGIGKGKAGTYRKLQKQLKDRVFVPTRKDYELAVELSRKCTESGRVLSIADLMNCAVSISKGWQILTCDADHNGAAMIDSRIKLLKIT